MREVQKSYSTRKRFESRLSRAQVVGPTSSSAPSAALACSPTAPSRRDPHPLRAPASVGRHPELCTVEEVREEAMLGSGADRPQRKPRSSFQKVHTQRAQQTGTCVTDRKWVESGRRAPRRRGG